MADISHTRRSFIKTVIMLLISGGALARYLTPAVHRQRRIVASAVTADIPEGGALLFGEQRLALFRDGGSGYYALSLICTHLGCTVSVTENSLACPCHGSRFDRHGGVLSGPATTPLRRLPVELHGDRVEVIG